MRKRKRIRMNEAMPALHERRLRALGVQPLRLRRRNNVDAGAESHPPHSPFVPKGEEPTTPFRRKGGAEANACAARGAQRRGDAAAPMFRRLALQPDPAELQDPAIHKMYQALTEAVSKAGLQSVRVCDVADDDSAAVMVFGAAPLPEGIPMLRVLRADPLRVLHVDRERKRLLWERMQSLGRGAGG
jgi:hypothetical protein